MDWIPETIFPEVKRPGREADHSASHSADKSEWNFTFTLLYPLGAWYLIVGTTLSVLHDFPIRRFSTINRNLHLTAPIQINPYTYPVT
jgi:hypothetical protein